MQQLLRDLPNVVLDFRDYPNVTPDRQLQVMKYVNILVRIIPDLLIEQGASPAVSVALLWRDLFVLTWEESCARHFSSWRSHTILR
jgi:hypothetical protein